MRKNLTLLIAGILLLATAGVAQAQGIYQAIGLKVVAREGGAAELAGKVVLFRQTGTVAAGTVTVTYSAPLAKGAEPMLMRGGALNTTGMVDLDADTVTLNRQP